LGSTLIKRYLEAFGVESTRLSVKKRRGKKIILQVDSAEKKGSQGRVNAQGVEDLASCLSSREDGL